jgi:hypothetical protein
MLLDHQVPVTLINSWAYRPGSVSFVPSFEHEVSYAAVLASVKQVPKNVRKHNFRSCSSVEFCGSIVLIMRMAPNCHLI